MKLHRMVLRFLCAFVVTVWLTGPTAGSLTQSAPRNDADPKASFAEGQAALQRGDLDAAEADFHKVLSLDPRSGAAYANLGVIAMRRQQWDHALALLQKAQALDPKMTGIRLNIGLIKYR